MGNEKKVIGQGVRPQVKSLSERVANLEQGLARILFSLNQRLGNLDQVDLDHGEKIDALVQLQGPEDVQSFINNARIERVRAAAAVEEASLKKGIEEGYITAIEAVGERSLVVGRYLLKDGTVQEPGRAQLVMPGIAPQFRDKLLGQKVGFGLDLPGGSKFELLEIYAVDEEKAKALEDAKQKAAAEAAMKAAQEAAAADEKKDDGQPVVETPSSGQPVYHPDVYDIPEETSTDPEAA